jgi:hypothetical protein
LKGTNIKPIKAMLSPSRTDFKIRIKSGIEEKDQIPLYNLNTQKAKDWLTKNIGNK